MNEKKLNLTDKEKNMMLNAGFNTDKKERSGSYILVDDEITESESNEEDGAEILPISMALNIYPWLKEYMWKLVDPNKDEYTKAAYNDEHPKGYFIYVPKGRKVKFPLQACFFVQASKKKQVVHNIIIMEEDSECHIINGCVSNTHIEQGYHIGVTEVFLKKNSFLSYTMIHNWSENVEVRPRSAVEVGENAQYLSNYISMHKVKTTQMAPTCRVTGKNGKARLYSILYAPEDTNLDIGGKIVLEAEGARGDIISRTISDGGIIKAPAEIEAKSDKVSGYMECSGLLLKDGGQIYALPSLNTHKSDVELAHEAAVGRIGSDEIEYLMSRGVSEQEAVSLIIQGFLDIKIKGLPDFLQSSIDSAIEESLKGS